MKDNNFDFISEKFADSGVNAPPEINEDLIEQRLTGVQPLTVKKSYKKLIAGVSAAAVLALVTAGAITFTGLFNSVPSPGEPELTPGSSASLREFKSRGEVCEELKTINKIKSVVNRYGNLDYSGGVLEYGAADSANGSSNDAARSYASGSSPADSYHNSTYVQTTGVDEADTLKTNGKYIFYLNEGIDVFTAEGKSSKKAATIAVPSYDSGSYSYINDFYVTGDRLITLSTVSGGFSDWQNTTAADIYDISDISNVKHTGSFTQSGRCVSSRMIGDMLYIVSDYYAYDEDTLPKTGGFNDGTADSATMDEVPFGNIYAVRTPVDSSFLIVSAADTASGSHDIQTKAILGSADTVYCNLDNLYVTAAEYAPVVYNNLLDYSTDEAGTDGKADSDLFTGSFYRSPEQTQIIRVSLKNGIDFTAATSVTGIIDNQYSLDEYNGNLRVATTSYDSSYRTVNNLFVLDSELKELGKVTGFAPDESIKAVRYIGETAYVITYEQTDPLFVIDVSNPSKPEIKGEVKISGFSTMLVPVDDNTLLGIGYHSEDYPDDYIDMEVQSGLKIVTFDVTDKSNPKVIDTKIFKDYYSDAQNNPKALLVNFERGDYTVPFCHSEYSGAGVSESFGVINFRVDSGRINIVDEYVSDKFKSSIQGDQPAYYEYSYADRCACVGGDIYLLGKKQTYADDLLKNTDDYYMEFESVIDSVEYK